MFYSKLLSLQGLHLEPQVWLNSKYFVSMESSRNSNLSALKTVRFHLSNAQMLILAPKSSGGFKIYL